MIKKAKSLALIYCLFTFLAAGMAGLSYAEVNLPTIGQPSSTALSPADEQALGAEIVSQLRSFHYFLEDKEVTDYLKRVGRRLASHSGHQPSDFHFYVVRDRQVNAFALPGGHIGVNAGLILASESESEMAGVVAHEIAHVTQRHIARQVEASSRFNLTTVAALLVAVLAGASSDPDVAQAALSVGLASTAQQQINFTRSHEMEADRVGIRTLAEAGYNPKGMASFFQKMGERARLYGSGLPEILRTHPMSNTRVSEAMTRIAKYEHIPEATAEQELEYRLMRARLRVLTDPQSAEVVNFFKAQNADQQEKMDDQVRHYGLGLALYRSGRYKEATDLFTSLAEQKPDIVSYSMALADVLLAQGKRGSSLGVYKNLRQRFPDYQPLTLAYADALIQSDQPAQSRALLLGSDLLSRKEPEAHRLLSSAARALDRPAEAHYQMAEYHRLLREYRQALNQLDAGLRLDDLSKSDEARLKTAMSQLRDEVPKDFLKKYDRGDTRYGS
ncbi:MAG: M48 family metalloprotease [Nevskiales bacterium]